MDNHNLTALPTDADLARQVDAFSQHYLSPVMLEATENREDGLIIALALIQKSIEMLRLTMPTEVGAIELFEELAATHVRNLRCANTDSSAP